MQTTKRLPLIGEGDKFNSVSLPRIKTTHWLTGESCLAANGFHSISSHRQCALRQQASNGEEHSGFGHAYEMFKHKRRLPPNLLFSWPCKSAISLGLAVFLVRPARQIAKRSTHKIHSIMAHNSTASWLGKKCAHWNDAWFSVLILGSTLYFCHAPCRALARSC